MQKPSESLGADGPLSSFKLLPRCGTHCQDLPSRRWRLIRFIAAGHMMAVRPEKKLFTHNADGDILAAGVVSTVKAVGRP